MEAVFDVQRQEVITRDNAMVSCDAVVFTQVYDAAKAAYEVENLRLAISNLVLTNLRTVVGSLELDEVLSQRDQINIKLLQTIDAATSPWGIKVAVSYTHLDVYKRQPIPAHRPYNGVCNNSCDISPHNVF